MSEKVPVDVKAVTPSPKTGSVRSTPITGSEVVFGTDERRTIGIVQTENDNNSAEIAEIRGEDGKILVQKATSKTREMTFEAIFLSGVTPPAAGATVTIAAGTENEWTGIVTASNITKSNNDWVKVSITAQKKDSAVLVPYA